MKKTLLNLLAIVALGSAFTGCAVKNTDTTAEKTAKHVVNAPVTVVTGTVGLIKTTLENINYDSEEEKLAAKIQRKKEREEEEKSRAFINELHDDFEGQSLRIRKDREKRRIENVAFFKKYNIPLKPHMLIPIPMDLSKPIPNPENYKQFLNN